MAERRDGRSMLCITTCIYFGGKVVKMKLPFGLLWCLFVHGVSGAADTNKVSVFVTEGDSVALNNSVLTNQDRIRWYYNYTRIAEINRDQSKTCTDVQCNEGTERFRDRLKLDHQTGSLTITNTRNTDSGEYQLVSSGSSDSEKIFIVSVTGASGADTDEVPVSVMEGDSVTLYTGVQTNQQEKIMWYFNGIRIAQINGEQSKICTDVQCKERFRDRLKLDHQTGSLTITNTRNTDSGEYNLKISNGRSDTGKIFSVSVTGVSAAERDGVKRKEGESVNLDPGLRRKPNDVKRWYFKDTLIAEITGDQSKICADVQCKERFRDRLKLDHQTGSLNITNITNTDSGEYKLQINNSRFSIIKNFSVSVSAPPDSGPSSTVRAGISVGVAAVVLLVAAVIYYRHRSKQKVQTGNGTLCHDHHQEDDVREETPLNHTGSPQETVANGQSHMETETAL